MAAKRVKVTDPHTGVELSVREGSAQAKAWGKPAKESAPKGKPVKKSD